MFLPKIKPILWDADNGKLVNTIENNSIIKKLESIKTVQVLPFNHCEGIKRDYFGVDGLLYIYFPGLPEIENKENNNNKA
jgi:hypothetical protein